MSAYHTAFSGQLDSMDCSAVWSSLLASATRGMCSLPLVTLTSIMFSISFILQTSERILRQCRATDKSCRKFHLRGRPSLLDWGVWDWGGKYCEWSASYQGTLSTLGSKTQPMSAWHAGAAGIQNQHSNFNVTLLSGRIYQCRSAALKCLYFFQASLNFNSTQKCKCDLTLQLTKLNLINICEYLRQVALLWHYSVTALHV